MKTVDIFGVPLDLGAGRRGVDMGPTAFRIAGVTRSIRGLGYVVQDRGNLAVPIPEVLAHSDDRSRYAAEIGAVCQQLHDAVRDSILAEHIPICLGGDHSLAAGSIAGLASAGRETGKPHGVLWVDAHADMNTPETSPSGNVHGMPLACVLGAGPVELVQIGGSSPKVQPERCAVLGLRNLDHQEKALVRQSGVHAFTMKDIDRRGMSSVVEEALSVICAGDADLHVSFDMDSLDPSISPGVGTPVQGGLSYREAHLLMEMVADCRRLAALDMVEVNPILDNHNATASLGVELILSALGKEIL